MSRRGLSSLLRTHSVRLSDIFVHLDDDGSFSLLELAGHLPARAINGGEEGLPAPSSVAKLGQALLDLERVAAAAAAPDVHVYLTALNLSLIHI